MLEIAVSKTLLSLPVVLAADKVLKVGFNMIEFDDM